MFSRFVDDDLSPVVRRNFDALVCARLVSNACYRYAPPFIAIIARGLDVSVADLGVALMVAEFAGLLSPFIGRRVDRANRLVAMATGMSLLATGTVAAALSTTVVVFAASVFVMNAAKMVFDTSLIVWVNDHVPYERRGRVVGIIETSWALGLFLGVSSMGLVTTVWSWRQGLVIGAIAMVVTGTVAVARLPRHEARPPVMHSSDRRLPPVAWLVVASMFSLMGASQSVGVTFGPWFEDNFKFSGRTLVAVVIALGIAELAASVGSARVTDRWGKERSVLRGSLLMVVTALAMIVSPHTHTVAVAAVVLFMLGFEFAVVSILPLAAHIVPGASGVGLGLAIGAGTTGRAVFSALSTRLYESHGPSGPATASAVLAMTSAVLVTAYARYGSRT